MYERRIYIYVREYACINCIYGYALVVNTYTSYIVLIIIICIHAYICIRTCSPSPNDSLISIAYTVSVANAYINKKPLNTNNNTSLLISLFLLLELLLLLFIILLRLFGVNKLSANIGPEPDFLFGVPVNTEPAVKVLLLLLLLLFEVLLFVLELLEVELVELLSSLDLNIDNKFF